MSIKVNSEFVDYQNHIRNNKDFVKSQLYELSKRVGVRFFRMLIKDFEAVEAYEACVLFNEVIQKAVADKVPETVSKITVSKSISIKYVSLLVRDFVVKKEQTV